MIKRLRLLNFRSIVDVSVELSPLTVLIGRSGTGKTNIVEGVRFWRDFLVRRNWQPYQSEWPRVLWGGAQDKPFGIEVAFEIPGSSGEFAYELIYGPANKPFPLPQLTRECLRYGGATLFHQQDRKWIHPPELVQVPAPGEPALGAAYGIPELKLAHVALTQGIGCYDFPGNVLAPAQVNTNATHEGLSDRADNFLQVYQTISNALGNPQWREIVAALRTLNDTIATLDVSSQHGKRVVVGHRTAGGKALALDLSQESEGFRRFLAHLLALYQIPAKPTLIFEEAEKGIYPGALTALADRFKLAVDRGTAQVILTTHSPQLLDHFPVESIRVVTMENYQTRVGPLAAEQTDAVRQDLLCPGELLTADPARVAEQA